MVDFNRKIFGKYQNYDSIYSVFHATDAFLLEDELNESQWEKIEQIASALRLQFNSGFTNNFTINAENYTNFFAIENVNSPNTLLVNGYQLNVGANNPGSLPSGLTEADNRLIVKLNSVSGLNRTDLVILEAWFEIISGNDTINKFGAVDSVILNNDIIDSRVEKETSRRIQFRWRVRSIDGQNSMSGVTAYKYDSTDSGVVYTTLGNIYIADTGEQHLGDGSLKSPGIVYGIPLFTVTRNGTDVVALENIADISPKATIVSGIARDDITNASNIIQDANHRFVTDSEKSTWNTPVTASDIGLGNVTNESKTTMFTSPTFTGSVAEGNATVASGIDSHAEGYLTQALDLYSHAEGYKSSTAITNSNLTLSGSQCDKIVDSGNNLSITGATINDTTISSLLSGLGPFTNVPFVSYHSAGRNIAYNHVVIPTVTVSLDGTQLTFNPALTVTSTFETIGSISLPGINLSSHAEGYNTIAYGSAAHAEGFQTTSKNIGTHAEGYLTQSLGVSSHAEGYETTAYTDFSHAEGQYSLAARSSNVWKIASFDSVAKTVTVTDTNFNIDAGDAVVIKILGSTPVYDTVASSSIPDGIITLTNNTPSSNWTHILKLYTTDIPVFDPLHAEGKNSIAAGKSSHVEGESTIAAGDFSHAEGYGTIAGGDYSHAEGDNSIAKGFASHAEGQQTYAGYSSHSEGYRNVALPSQVASGIVSFDSTAKTVKLRSVKGFSTTYTLTLVAANSIAFETAIVSIDTTTRIITLKNAPSGDWFYAIQQGAQTSSAHAEGTLTVAAGHNSHTEGEFTVALGSDSHAEGGYTQSIGDFSHAEGYHTVAGQMGHSEGWYSIAMYSTETLVITGFDGTNKTITVESISSFVVGENILIKLDGNDAVFDTIANINGNIITLSDNTPSSSYKYVFHLSNAASATTHAEGYNTIASGAYSHAEGQNSIALGSNSHAEGSNTKATGQFSHAEGNANISSGDNSHAEGHMTVASSNSSHAEGNSTTASGQNSHAEGLTTTASGQNSHTEGNNTQALGYSSHAEGSNTKASLDYSHAEGNSTQALGTGSHTEGSNTIAYADYSHAEGSSSKSGAVNSHAEGYSTSANSNYAHTEGSLTIAGYAAPILTGNVSTKQITLNSGGSNFLPGSTAILLYNDTSNNRSILPIVVNSVSGNVLTVSFVPSFNVLLSLSPTNVDTTNIGGNAAHAEGQSTLALGTASHAEGFLTQAEGNYSHAEGSNTQATGQFSHSEGSGTTASGQGSHAEGSSSASGNYSHAEGDSTTADGIASHSEGYQTSASGDYSHAEGNGVYASGQNSHAEGMSSSSLASNSHAEGSNTIAGGYASHAEGYTTGAGGSYSHAEGSFNFAGYAAVISSANIAANQLTLASGGTNFTDNTDVILVYDDTNGIRQVITVHINSVSTNTITLAYCPDGTMLYLGTTLSDTNTIGGSNAHAEGKNTLALGSNSHVEGTGSRVKATSFAVPVNFTAYDGQSKSLDSLKDQGAHAEGVWTTSENIGTHSEGIATKASGTAAHAEGMNNTATGQYSHAEGSNTNSTGNSSHTEGSGTSASNDSAHAEGINTTASGTSSHAEGSGTTASGGVSHAEGSITTASGFNAHAEGNATWAAGDYSHASGYYTQSNYVQTAIGQFNTVSAASNSSYNAAYEIFIIGNGTSTSARGNAFKVLGNGQTYADGAYASTGADYAEYFEWADENPDNEDRVGYFVTLDGEKIRKATSADQYILGIVSSTPSVVGDNFEAWCGKYITDDWGRIQYEWVDVPAQTDKNGNEINPARKDYLPKYNPDWNPEQEYISREHRKEWSPIGMMGKLLVRDDGTCQVNGFCKSNDNGIAIVSNTPQDGLSYRVLKRVSDNIIQVLVK